MWYILLSHLQSWLHANSHDHYIHFDNIGPSLVILSINYGGSAARLRVHIIHKHKIGIYLLGLLNQHAKTWVQTLLIHSVMVINEVFSVSLW